MTKIELLVVIVLAALACANETEESEKNKRGAGKTTNLNSIPSGAQKPDYTYNIYSQSPSSQISQPTYQSQVPNSFYPNQGSQYSAPTYTQAEPSSYQQQPQINLIPPTTSSQFVPINFIPNTGYQTKYQLVPSKSSNGNIQLAILQQTPNYQSPLLQYPQGLISPHPTSQFPQQSQIYNSISPQGHFNVPNYQPLSFGNSYLGQPSMLLLPQPNPSLYNNLYSNPLQSIYNYYPASNQAKYGAYAPSQPQTTDYEKIQTPSQQGISKEDNDINVHNSDYVSASDSNYKNAYAASRSSSYTKL